jgi:GNAT superfamily N-acetyltransferase
VRCAFSGRRSRLAARALAALYDHHPQEPHWYLLYVGVTPASQGSGVGSAVMQPVLDQCDREHLPAYLEATCERNRALYRRHGFIDRDLLPLPDGGPPMYPMWRDPR